MLVELVILLALHADDKNEAELLFRKMETKLANAKSLECTFEGKIEGGKKDGKFKGSLALAEGNKSRLEVEFVGGGPEMKITLVSDGQNKGSLDGKEPKSPAPKWLNDSYRAALTRAGAVWPLFQGGQPPKEFKADEVLKISDFKLGKKEKVGDQEAQVVKYNLQPKDSPDALAATAWIDTKTNLPLKREIVMKIGEEKMTITETYSKWSIDEKIDPKKFELPKD